MTLKNMLRFSLAAGVAVASAFPIYVVTQYVRGKAPTQKAEACAELCAPRHSLWTQHGCYCDHGCDGMIMPLEGR